MPLLEIRHIRHRFDGIDALKDVSLTVDPGEILGVIGPNGSGKSTLFDIVAGRLKPTEGRVVFDGKDVTTLPPHVRCRMGIGRTFQIVRPFPELSTLENVLVASTFARGKRDPHRTRDEARRLLGRVGLEACADLPARKLSLGQLKLLELTRALASQPRLLLLDEVGAGLSPGAGADLAALLLQLRSEGMTILGIEHSPRAVADISDRIYALDRGEIIMEGLPAAVLDNARVIEAYLGE
ncbi:MAG: ABC transporter ATP-binding protein [Rudaea sp.]